MEFDNLYLEPNTVLITPNRRLSNFVSMYLCRKDKSRQSDVQIYPFSEFIGHLYTYCKWAQGEVKTLLTDLQKQIIMQKIIEKSEFNDGLLKINSTAEKVLQAIKMVKLWQIETDELKSSADQDVNAFISWFDSYNEFLDSNGFIDSEGLAKVLSVSLTNVSEHWFSTLKMIGFNEVAPLHNKILTVLQSHNICIEEVRLSNRPFVAKCDFNKCDDEWSEAIRWARTCYQDYPDEQVAIVVPELSTHRKEFVKELYKYFPEHEVNVSAPWPLANYPLISDILKTLDLLKPKIRFEEISLWLRTCDCVGDGVLDKASKSKFELYLRTSGRSDFFHNDLVKMLELFQGNEYFTWVSDLLNVLSLFQSTNKERTAPEWVTFIREVLSVIRWPGNIRSDKLHNDLITCLKQSLLDFSSLGFVLGPINYPKAIEKLTFTLNNTPFLPETNATRVHVLGLLEASGLPFDNLWITGLSEKTWPPEPDPNPFIPASIQKKYNLPRSSSQREYDVSVLLTDEFKRTAIKKLILSHSRNSGDLSFRGSSLLASVPLIPIEEINSYRKNIFQVSPEVETLQGYEGLKYDGMVLSRGLSVLQDQAICPFKSYAKHRLKLGALDKIYFSLSPAEHGQVLHSVLASVWRKYKSKRKLIGESDNKLIENVANIVEHELNKFISKSTRMLPKDLCLYESTRLKAKVLGWLDFEKSRDDFEVLSVEKAFKLFISEFMINIRIDRIDSASGSTIVIDYKTGSVEPSRWFGTRIQEPQLPAYSLIDDESIIGVVAACFKNNDYAFKGVSEDITSFPGAKDIQNYSKQFEGDINTFKDFKGGWKQRLEAVAIEFKHGKAKVSPINKEATCRFCDFRSLCKKDSLGVINDN